MRGRVDGTPQALPLKKTLSVFFEHRRDVIRRRTEYDLDEANDRRHVLQGLKVALDNLDRIIELIRKSRTREAASDGLTTAFALTPIQARAILDMPLGRLAALERQKILDELRAVE